MTFEFISEGLRGCIIKVVQYTPLHVGNYYNLGFGDRDLQTGLISDRTVSDNGDSKKVLATVASTLDFFLISQINEFIEDPHCLRQKKTVIKMQNLLHAIKPDLSLRL
jgi:hypothetical protein